MKHKFFQLILLSLFLVTPVLADSENVIRTFEEYYALPPLNPVVPTVYELPLQNVVYRDNDVAVYDETNKIFIGSYLKHEIKEEVVPLIINTVPQSMTQHLLADNSIDEAVRFSVPADYKGAVDINIFTGRPVTATSFSLNLDRYVSLPTTVTITAETERGTEIVVATKRMDSTVVTFPAITAQVWKVTLTYSQPLAITEVSLNEFGVKSNIDKSVRFLAQPNTKYRVYVNPDINVPIDRTEVGNLSNSDGVSLLGELPLLKNPLYQPSDFDDDGVKDILDNCIQLANPEQTDIDNNGLGDDCDDFDRDGMSNSVDNCVNNPNRSQGDLDNDGIGDECDTEESRITERYVWVPWVGMGIALSVLILLFWLVAHDSKRLKEATEKKEEVKS